MEFIFIYLLIGCIVWLYSPTQEYFDDSIRMAFHCIVLWGWWLLVCAFLLLFGPK